MDSECLGRYLKLQVKQITESDGDVVGTLLLTPTCLMFDPDLSDYLVTVKGQDPFGLVCNLAEIISISVYKDSTALTGNSIERKRKIFDPDHYKNFIVPEEIEQNDDTVSMDSCDEEQQESSSNARNRSLGALTDLLAKTKLAREDARKITPVRKSFDNVESHENRMDAVVPEVLSHSQKQNCQEDDSSATTYFMVVRKRKNKNAAGMSLNNSLTSLDENLPFGSKERKEFWFVVPVDVADNVYEFLLQWLPDKYGMDTSMLDESEPSMVLDPHSTEQSFVILDSSSDDSLFCGDVSYASNSLDKEWEFVAISELWRRIRPDKLIDAEPLLPGGDISKILDQEMTINILSVLPARAQGYAWIKVYASAKDGSLLSTMYRNIKKFAERDSTPLLIIVKDNLGNIFGGVVSGPFSPMWKFQGTGGCFLWRYNLEADCKILRQYTWTGRNDYFVLAAKDYFCMGAGKGHHGLYLDADLLHGHTERCETYGNEVLTGGDKDFIVDVVEVFGFRL